MDDDRDIYAFIDKVESGDQEACRMWEDYLEWLAIFAANIRMVFNNNLIIGGEIGRIIDPYLSKLRKKMAEYDLFARDIDYIYGCKIKKNAMATGAARLALNKYRDRILENIEKE